MTPTMARGAEAYYQTHVQSRSPLELVVMLYDGALRFLGEAAEAAERKDIRARSHAVSRTLAIVAELQNTLDLEKGGAIADQLDDLYTYMTSRLLDVAIKNDVTAIEETRKLLAPMRDAWNQISQPSVPVGAP